MSFYGVFIDFITDSICTTGVVFVQNLQVVAVGSVGTHDIKV